MALVPAWSIEVNARATLPKDTHPGGNAPLRVYTIASLAVAPCYRIGLFGGCGLVVGSSLLTAASLKDSTLDATHFLGLGSRVFLEHSLSDRWSLRVDAEMVLPALRSRMDPLDEPTRWNTREVTGGASISFLTWF